MGIKRYDIIMAVPGKEGKTYWRTIGTIFANEDSLLEQDGHKPAGFKIDFPAASGIVVPSKVKEDKDEEPPV